MRSDLFGWRATSALVVGLGLFAGCIVVQPLEDYPTKSSGGISGRGGSAGSASQPEGGEGGSPSDVGGKGGTAGASSGRCETNADCKSAGIADEPYLCRQEDHKCVRLREPVCPVAIAEEIDNPNSIVLGAFATLSPTNPESSPIVYAHQLAMEELSGNLIGGLPHGPNDSRRPLSLVICYNQENMVDAGLEHLIDDLGVKGVLATLKPGDMLRAYDKYADRDVFYLNPVSVTEPVAGLEDNDKVWNLMGQPKDLVPTYAALLPLVEDYARDLHAPVDGKVKIALVTTLDAFDVELAQKLKPALIFNDATSLESNTANGHYKMFTAQGTSPENVEEVVDALVDFQPDIIISAASEVMTMLDGVVKFTEANWAFGPNVDAPEPVWLLSPYNAGDLGNVSQSIGTAAVEQNEPLMQERFLGVSIAGPQNGDAQFDYSSRLKGRFGNSVYDDTANYYDASYLLAYAMYAAGNEEPLTGSSIARGMQRLISGTPTAIGPDNILDVFEALAVQGSTLELQSTLGPPSFDGKTGVRQVDGSVFCFKRQDTLVEPILDTVRYDRTQKKLIETGKFCLDNFIK